MSLVLARRSFFEDLRRRRKKTKLLTGESLNGKENRGSSTAGEGGNGILVPFPIDGSDRLQSKLQVADERAAMLQKGLHMARQECMEFEGGRILSERLDQQDGLVQSLRKELLHARLSAQSLQAQKNDLLNRVSELERQLGDLRQDVRQKEKQILHLKEQLDETLRALSASNRSSSPQKAKGGDAGEKRVVSEGVETGTRPSSPKKGREELQVVRDAIHSLRGSFRATDSQQHTLDTLEQSVSVLLERLGSLETRTAWVSPHASSHASPHPVPPSHPRRTRDASNTKRMPITAFLGSNGENSTKVIYFTERTVTPFLTSVPRRLGEVTLADFKQVFDRAGNYRFHFRSHDPEFGLVKEEISKDESILPGMDGKIICWVEEDHSSC